MRQLLCTLVASVAALLIPLVAVAGPHLGTVTVCETTAQVLERVEAWSCPHDAYCLPPSYEPQCWTEQAWVGCRDPNACGALSREERRLTDLGLFVPTAAELGVNYGTIGAEDWPGIALLGLSDDTATMDTATMAGIELSVPDNIFCGKDPRCSTEMFPRMTIEFEIWNGIMNEDLAKRRLVAAFPLGSTRSENFGTGATNCGIMRLENQMMDRKGGANMTLVPEGGPLGRWTCPSIRATVSTTAARVSGGG